jgi:WD40 repeat protein
VHLNDLPIGDIRAIDANHLRAITIHEDKTARIWDITTGQPVGMLEGHDGHIWRAVFTRDGNRARTGAEDGTARIWDIATGNTMAVLRGHVRRVTGVAFSPEGRYAITASLGDTVRVWDAATGQQLAVRDIPGMTYAYGPAIALPAGGRQAVTGFGDATVHVWDVATGTDFQILQPKGYPTRTGRVGWIAEADLDEKSARLFTAEVIIVPGYGHDYAMQVWDVVNGTFISGIGKHRDNWVGFDKAGTVAITAGTDGALRLWDTNTGALIAERPSDGGPVHRATVNGDDTRCLVYRQNQTFDVLENVVG